MNTIGKYTDDLADILNKTLAVTDVEEIISEVTSHLSERRDELVALGSDLMAAEAQAINEFGQVSEMAVALASEFPPRTPIDPRRVAWLPEVLIAVVGTLAGYSFEQSMKVSDFGGGLTSQAQIILGATPSMIIPGIFMALGRIRYRRAKTVDFVNRMAYYGFALALVSLTQVGIWKVMNHLPLASPDWIYAVFGTATVLGYVAMVVLQKNQRVQNAIYRRMTQ